MTELGRKRIENLKCTLMCETMVDPDLAMKHRQVLSESTISHGGKDWTIVKYKQVLQSAIEPGSSNRNWNGRGYHMSTIINALDNNPIIQHELKTPGGSTWVGEYGHPFEASTEAATRRQNTIDPKYICNKINKYWVEGNLLMSECETLAESWGAVLTARILTNLPAMASCRSMGRVDSNGIVVPEGYWIVTFDTVVRPSHKEAMQVGAAQIATPQNHTMNESAISIDLTNDGVKDFILTESARDVEMISTVGGFDPKTIRIENGSITMKRISESGLQLETVYIPIKTVLGSNYHQLF